MAKKVKTSTGRYIDIKTREEYMNMRPKDRFRYFVRTLESFGPRKMEFTAPKEKDMWPADCIPQPDRKAYMMYIYRVEKGLSQEEFGEKVFPNNPGRQPVMSRYISGERGEDGIVESFEAALGVSLRREDNGYPPAPSRLVNEPTRANIPRRAEGVKTYELQKDKGSTQRMLMAMEGPRIPLIDSHSYSVKFDGDYLYPVVPSDTICTVRSQHGVVAQRGDVVMLLPADENSKLRVILLYESNDADHWHLACTNPPSKETFLKEEWPEIVVIYETQRPRHTVDK